jgi:trigger factor
MRSSVEPLEGNKVKLSVEVDEQEFDRAIDAAFKKIAREVRIPGFRPGKAPRRLLEQRLGGEYARQEALRDSLPEYYAKAVHENDVDVIAPPEIDITSGEESGPVAFDAVVEVRPRVSVPGYAGLQVTIPSPEVTDEEIDRQIDRLRNNFAELDVVDRPAQDGDHVTIDLTGSKEKGGDPLEGLTATDFLYEIGSGTVLPELDDQIRATKPGDIVDFTATVPVGGPDAEPEPVHFRVLVKEVKEKLLPDVTDEWASEASEFETVDELKGDIRTRLGAVKKLQAQMALRDAVVEELVKLVDEDPPEALVGAELERRIHDFGHRLEHQGVDLAQYMEATGTSQEDLIGQLRETAISAVKADLALRSVAEAESIEVTDEDVEREIERLAERTQQKPQKVRQQLERGEQLPAVRSDIGKGKALEWLVEHVELVDEDGNPIERSALELVSPEQQSQDEGAEENAPEGSE